MKSRIHVVCKVVGSFILFLVLHVVKLLGMPSPAWENKTAAKSKHIKLRHASTLDDSNLTPSRHASSKNNNNSSINNDTNSILLMLIIYY